MLLAGRSELLLLSGGLDSAALAYMRRPRVALTVDYGQVVAASEIRAAAAICNDLGIEHHTLRADIRALGRGVMCDGIEQDGSPTPEWWPYRNQFLISFAAAKAINLGLPDVVIGTVKGDGVHADGTPAFVEAMRTVLTIQEGAVRLEAPALDLEAADLLRQSRAPISFLAWTFSCHLASEPCGQCRGCYKHAATIESVFGLDQD